MIKEDIYCSTAYMYNLSNDAAITTRYVIQMKDEVNPEALRKAIDTTMTRYPYLGRHQKSTLFGYCYVPNTRPIAVIKSKDSVALNGPEANFHLFALSYWGNTIYFHNTHAFFDGRGRSLILHTLIYYYCAFRYNETPEMPDVVLAGTPVNPAENEDPMRRELPKSNFKVFRSKPVKNVMRLFDLELKDRSKIIVNRLRISESELMKLCKSNDATPNTAISLLFCRALNKVHPDSDKNIVAGVYCDLRNVYHSPLSHHCMVEPLSLNFKTEMRKLAFHEQNSIFRGMLMLLSDPEALIPLIRWRKLQFTALRLIPSLKLRIKLAHSAVTEVVDGTTFISSYSGKNGFGSCESHIAATFPEPFAKDNAVTIEITVDNGYFFITYCQCGDSLTYYNAFLDEISDMGLSFEELYHGEGKPATFVED